MHREAAVTTLSIRRSKSNKTGPPQLFHVQDRQDFFDIGTAVELLRKHSDFPRSHHRPEDPLLPRADGSAYSYSWFFKSMRRALAKAGFDPSDFGTHSLRAGGATDAYLSGIPKRVIMAQGRWSSSAIDVYIRIAKASVTRHWHRLGKHREATVQEHRGQALAQAPAQVLHKRPSVPEPGQQPQIGEPLRPFTSILDILRDE